MNQKKIILSVFVVSVVALLGFGYSLQNYISNLDIEFDGTKFEIGNPDSDRSLLKAEVVIDDNEEISINNNLISVDEVGEGFLSSVDSVILQGNGKIDLEIGDEALIEVFEGASDLRVGVDGNRVSVLSLNSDGEEGERFHIRLVLSDISSIENSGTTTGEINLAGGVYNNLSLIKASNGTINAPNVDTRDLSIEIFGGDINIGGEVEDLAVNNASSDGNLFGGGLVAEDTNVIITQSGVVELGSVEGLIKQVSPNGVLDIVSVEEE